MSEPFVTVRALLTHVDGAWATVGKEHLPHCTDCPHDLMDHRLHPFDVEQMSMGGFISCPLCDCSGTFSYNPVPGFEGPDCDSPTDGGE